MFSPLARRIIFIAFIVFSAATAVYHAVGTFKQINDSPPWRNALFIGVNLLCVYGFAKRPRWFVWFFGILMLQQFYSHGGDMVQLWQAQHRVDWLAVAVLVAFPFGFAALVADARRG